MTTISVKDVLCTNLCIYREQADTIYHLVDNHLSQGEKVTLCFNGVGVIISHFIHPLLCKLYSRYGDFLDDLLCVTGLSKEDAEFFNSIMIYAKGDRI